MIQELRKAERKRYNVHLSLTDGSTYSGIVSLNMGQMKLRLKYRGGIVTVPFHEIKHCSTLIPMSV
ncbi:hypothetical protein PUW24_12565 [Paenibacillus urinalis]|uniref:Uncharacterized protein n=2 Tax=Paenibacillus TaxID=44249 RepID=A0AAX3N177_9BACL|nr:MULTISPECIES: hypothetical protein [Paenibacillus]OMC72104.1 hypothetical protein BK126_08840 [Paenibacillus sp. FSL H7-0326]WDH83620.1 hypothetical protein PUW23_05150 [Paenibacillus urinalis]WDH99649.1 hypothetical protein PUW24_12565 [Paenibacillus urinalis]WDI03281.1 hypothetical protein PUW25_04695 [Paenibacillus urinalis]SDX35343.1 hypothetical protein SAMN05518848_106337 [Paenibacillus sp. PDC88]